MFDLMQIKEEVEGLFDVEFTVRELDYRDGKELYYKKGKNQVRISILRYSATEKKGQEFISFDFWDGTSGLGSPCDSELELFECCDRIKMPRRPVRREKQLTLF